MSNLNNKLEEEKILHKINEMAEEPEVPDSLLPENIMKTIKKSDKVTKIKKTNKDKGTSKNRKIWYIGTGSLVVVAAAALVMVVVHKGDIFKSSNVNGNPTKLSDELVLNEEETDIVLSSTTREEIFIKVLNSVESERKYLGSTYEDMVENSEEYKTNSDMVTPSEGEDSFYQNNDQVQGVVEADKVITDGEYIYALSSDNEISITKVKNGDMEYVSTINFGKDFKNSINEELYFSEEKFFVSGNKLVIIAEYYTKTEGEYNINSGFIYEDVLYIYKYDTCIIQYDLSDKENPVMDTYNTIDGEYISARRVDNYIYLVTNKNINTCIGYNENEIKGLARILEDCIPKISDEEMSCGNIYIEEDKEDYCNYKILTAFNIGKDELICTDNKAILSDGNAEMYMSADNIYIYNRVYNREDMQKKLEVGESVFLYSTNIYKFDYAEGKINQKAKGTVNGEILNQFSMDEYNGYLRLVSSLNEHKRIEEKEDGYTGIEVIDNNAVYILDENLNICGNIENIAEDEEIYSARFMGDYCYFITFMQTDPLFVADLSDVKNPLILDELKMPGFSSYLHMWNEDLLFGVGEEGDENGNMQGLKLAMYDVSDKSNICEVTKLVEEDLWASNNYDYKNMMVAPEKSIFGLEVYHSYEMCESEVGDEGETVFRYTVYEFGYNVYEYKENKFNKVLNYVYKAGENQNYEYRGLYVGDVLYVIVLDEGIQSFSLNNYEKVDFVGFD